MALQRIPEGLCTVLRGTFALFFDFFLGIFIRDRQRSSYLFFFRPHTQTNDKE